MHLRVKTHPRCEILQSLVLLQNDTLLSMLTLGKTLVRALENAKLDLNTNEFDLARLDRWEEALSNWGNCRRFVLALSSSAIADDFNGNWLPIPQAPLEGNAGLRGSESVKEFSSRVRRSLMRSVILSEPAASRRI